MKLRRSVFINLFKTYLERKLDYLLVFVFIWTIHIEYSSERLSYIIMLHYKEADLSDLGWIIEDEYGKGVGWVNLQSFYGRPAYDATEEVGIFCA